ncbi:MAG: DNA alkylation repair protein [archaeon]
MILKLRKELDSLKNPQKAKIQQGFFKTGTGEYGEGDIFLGIAVPVQRRLARKYLNLTLSEIQNLLDSKIHEERLVGLIILVNKFNVGNDPKQIFDFYLKNTKNINNWDLVDLTAHKIIGEYLLDKNRAVLYKLARSENLWEKRISIIATFAFIRNNDFGDSLKISELLLNDKNDLIHKAVGWMLREIGKKDLEAEEIFLKKNYRKMPRTMLRYAIERFSESKRKYYMSK